MNYRTAVPFLALLLTTGAFAASAPGAIKKGDKLQTLVNLHPDVKQHLLYSINYQLSARIPVCADVTVKAVGSDGIEFVYQDQRYTFKNDSYTKSTKIPFQTVLQNFFGPKCDDEKIKSMSDIDRDGIARGAPDIGMTREGVLIAMGRPPFHANPSLDVSEWMYWRNRFGRIAVQFDSAGKVKGIR